MRYFFIDLENVRSEGLEGVLSLGSDDMVFIYYSDNAMNLSIPTLENLNSSKASKKFIKTNYIGKNAMDFQIVSLFGAMIERNKKGSYYIISQDNGFRSAVSFCESYFEEYGIICGVYPTIIAAITDELKKNIGKQKTEADTEEKRDNDSPEKPSKKKHHRKKKSKDSQKTNSNGQQVNEVDASENAQTEASTDEPDEEPEAPVEKTATPEESAVKEEKPAVNKLGYIYEILKELLSEKTIDIYAAVIDEGIAKCKNRDELHEFFHARFGEDEGEALYRVTQGDFEKMKQLRPKRPSRSRHRSKKNHSANSQTIS